MTTSGIFLYILFAVILFALFAYVMVKRFQRAVRLTAANPSPASDPARLNRKQSIALMFLLLGIFGIFYGITQRPPAREKLISSTGEVTKVLTVSERLKDNESSSPSSVNPFQTHDWIELTVESVGSSSQGDVAPSSDSDDKTHIWKVATSLSGQDLQLLSGARITALVKDLQYRSEAFEVKKDTGEVIATYDSTTSMPRLAFQLFLTLGSISILVSAIVFLLSQRKSSQQ